ncbi:uncharacterized protein LOC132131953 [Carassius carassius]|uniref:uncharacterized protein LOC132131953 n=1 Tax=Carassius carassius TaxID=217509 RepID=UPI00286968C0|nr:uncharacterized protein LOC132131953 [Carassius carassius]
MVLLHLDSLGFRINREKSRLEPAQHTEYLGLSINSLSYRVTLTERRIASFTQCLSRFQTGKIVPFRLCLRMLGLMASVISVVRLGLLIMRDFQHWVAHLRLCSRRHLNRQVRVTYVCVRALRHWKSPATLRSGIPWGGSVVESHYDDGRIIEGLGSDSDGQSCERRLASSANSQTHKLLGIVGSVSSAETFSELHQGSACFSENRQFNSGCLYQPTGRHALSSAAPAGKRADCVVRHKAFIHQGNPCYRDIEQGGRFIVQRKSPVRRLEASSPGGEADMAEIRPGGRRSLRLAGKRSMSSVLLSGRRKCTIGCGCFSPPMAKCPAVCISPSEPDFTHSSQGEGNGIVADTDSPTLAIQTLGGRDS